MPNEIHSKLGSGKNKVWVCPVSGRESIIERLKEMVEAEGGELVYRDRTTLDGYHECVEAADVIVILICEETRADATYNAIVELASRLGRRVIGVWLDETEEESVPPPIEMHGDAVIRIKPEEVKRAVIEGEQLWNLPTGKPRPTQPLPRYQGH